MSNINCTHTITFRSKFEKFIKCDVEHEVFEAAFEKFLNFDENTAIDMLWNLAITADVKILEKIGLYDGICPEMLDTLRSELRHQYEKHHGKFFEKILNNKSEEVNHAYNALSGHINTVVATVVYQHCRSALYFGDYEIRRILYLLNNQNEQFYYGGLKALRFECWEAEYLKPYHELIHNLLQAMFEAYNEQMAETQNRPFAKFLNQVNFEHVESGDDLPYDFSEPNEKTHSVETETQLKKEPEKELETKQTFTPLSPENVLSNKDIFSAFVIHHDFACLGQLSKLGYDLNEIVAKEKAIRDFLTAVEAL